MKTKLTLLCVTALFFLDVLPPVQAQSTTFNLIYDFSALSGPDSTNNDGAESQGGLVLSGNMLYGTAFYGGSAGNGSVFRVNTDKSSFTNLYSFSATNGPNGTNEDGSNPLADLILSGDTLYGTTYYGGTGGSGTVFRINTDGSDFTNLYSFTANSGNPYYVNLDGAFPAADLVLSGNTLYGVAEFGGSAGVGTVFRVNTDKSGFTNLHNFPPITNSTNSDGAYPTGNLILSGNTLYGTAQSGGITANGTVFRVNTDKLGFTNLHNFPYVSAASPQTNSDGAILIAGLILSGGTLYGTALYGGSGGNGTVFSVNIDSSGFSNLYSFTITNGPNATNNDGATPYASLLLLGSTLYGTTELGGTGGSGTVFGLRTNGSNFVNLYNFTATSSASFTNSDGAFPLGGLILSGDTLYSTTEGGGDAGNGTVFALSLPAPLLTITPAPSKVVISWPGWGSNFVLQTATDLSFGAWSNITSGVTTQGTNYVFTNAVASQAAFFRLQQE